ncbi:MAG: PQQ-binding-like beta-propeller repeat protein, partial [Proteobacteria bacterium]|nr:PQQ-binding-like beta-propeller repeat protein [Pseudomonadota bacterium]
MNNSGGQKISKFTIATVFLSALVISGCEREQEKAPKQELSEPPAVSTKIADVDGDRIINADAEAGSWLAHGRTYDEQRFSPLDQINVESVGQLGLAWYFDTDVDRGLEASPIVVDGVIYTTGAWSMVYALDARSGELLWKYDPKVPGESGFDACCGVVNRGVAVWRGKVYVGTLDGRLVALNAEDGKVAWEVRTTPTDKP